MFLNSLCSPCLCGLKSMTPRERVLKAFKKLPGNPDRAPVQFDCAQALLEHFSEALNVPLNYTHNLYEDVTYRISGNEIKLGVRQRYYRDWRRAVQKAIGRRYKMMEAGSTNIGMRMKPGDLYIEVVEFPLAAVQTATDIAAYTFPDPNAAGRYDDAKESGEPLCGDLFYHRLSWLKHLFVSPAVGGHGKTDARHGRGRGISGTAVCSLYRFQIEIALNLIRSGVDAIWVGDDFGSQNNLLFSPRMFRKLLKHHYVRLVKMIKEANPDIILILHSDGAVRKLLPDIVEIGFDVFNPIQPGVPGLDPQEVKDEFGDHLMFWGGIDLSPAVSDNELESEDTGEIPHSWTGAGLCHCSGPYCAGRCAA